jgi:hypothetical protein
MVSEYFLYLHIFGGQTSSIEKTKIEIHLDVLIYSWVLSIKLVQERKTSIVTVAEENITLIFFKSTEMRLFLLFLEKSCQPFLYLLVSFKFNVFDLVFCS